jgi:membrane fusion protein (multidrug efflux system)
MTITSALLTLWLFACTGGDDGGSGGPEEHKGPKPQPVTVVGVALAERADVADLLLASAVVESDSQADVLAAATGIVVSLAKDEGDPVRKGEVLARIDNVQLDASASRASDDLARLEKEVARLEDLHRRGAVSQNDLDTARYQLSTARITAGEATKTQGQTRLLAPFDGVVAVRDVRVGQMLSAGSRAFQIVDPARLKVVASLPERDLSRVAVGQTGRLISAYDAKSEASAVVTRISPVIDSNSGTFRLTLAVDPDQKALRPGQFVSLELEVDRHEAVIVVPRDAVVWEDGKPMVYRMVPEKPKKEEEKKEEAPAAAATPSWWPFPAGTEDKPDTTEAKPDAEPPMVAERVFVDKGLTDQKNTEITRGLTDGEKIVVVGQSNLRDGARIREPKGDGVDGKDGTEAKEPDTEPEGSAQAKPKDGSPG